MVVALFILFLQFVLQFSNSAVERDKPTSTSVELREIETEVVHHAAFDTIQASRWNIFRGVLIGVFAMTFYHSFII